MKSFLLSNLELQDFPYKPNDPSKNDPKWKVNEEHYVCRALTVLDTIQLDHIFALDSHNKEVKFQFEKINRTSEHKINSPLAKAPISVESNRCWGPEGPEKKLKAILTHCSDKGDSQLLDLDNGWSSLNSQSITQSVMDETLLDNLLKIRFNLLKKRLDTMLKSENL